MPWVPVGIQSGISGTLQGFLLAAAALALLTAVFGLSGLLTFEDAVGPALDRAAIGDLAAADDRINLAGALFYLASLLVFVFVVIWSHQAHRASQARRPGPRTWAAGWAIAAWLVPLANVVLPKLVLTEIEGIACTQPGGDGRGRSAGRARTATVGWLWWITFVVGWTVGIIGFGMFDDPDLSETGWRTGYRLVIGGFGALAVSGAAGAWYVRRLSRVLAPVAPPFPFGTSV